ncbi:MAG: hypothetical protein JOZ54_04625 [Acidobacteria bacterium]|nr:hypothetical protein [Acidobacteriota bacterium]
MNRGLAAAIAISIGIAAAVATWWMPHPIRVAGVSLGDIALPLVGMKGFTLGANPYDLRLHGSAPALYPFTAMILLWPFTLLPLRLAAPAFMGLSSALLGWGVARHGRPWQLLLFLSPSYWSAVYSVQWSPAITAALLLPFLLPLAVVKPQLGVVLAAGGRWSRMPIVATLVLVSLSLAIWPVWPVEWLHKGNLHTFNGSVPLLVVPGFLLVGAVIAWRKREGRMLLAMAIVVQRYFYDQLPLYLIPKTWRQMTILLLTSWIAVAVCFRAGWIDVASGAQRRDVWIAVILGTFLPALALLVYNERFSSSSAATASSDPAPPPG